jgi:hypothetical protein
VAGKFFIRRFENGIIKKAPGQEELDKLHDVYPDVHVQLLAREGQELDELDYQDSYSYKLVIVYLGGMSREQMHQKFEHIKELLPFEIETAQKQ